MNRIVTEFQRVGADVVSQYLGIGSATVHEAQGRIGAVDPAIKPLSASMRICGPAFTVAMPPGDNLMLLKALQLVQPGDILVCDHAGAQDGPWGEMTSLAARHRGCGGLVIDGCVRDKSEVIALEFPIFSRGVSIVGTTKQALGYINHPITCGGVEVRPGDLVVGDADGVCVVRAEEAETVLQASRSRVAKEEAWASQLARGQEIWDLLALEPLAERLGLYRDDDAGT